MQSPRATIISLSYTSLYFHVPAGVEYKRSLFVGSKTTPLKSAKDTTNVGESEIAVLSSEIDVKTDSVTVGVSDFELVYAGRPEGVLLL